jgi:O-antigen ligase
LLQLSQLVGGQEIQTETSTSRLDYYKNELLLFIKNPVFGHNFFGYSAENVSGHSFTLDWLAATGTIGFATVAAMIRAFYRHTVRFSGAKVCKAVQLTWLMVILLSFLNPVVFPLITTVVFAACAFLQGYEESLQEPEITEPSSTKEESVP